MGHVLCSLESQPFWSVEVWNFFLTCKSYVLVLRLGNWSRFHEQTQVITVSNLTDFIECSGQLLSYWISVKLQSHRFFMKLEQLTGIIIQLTAILFQNGVKLIYFKCLLQFKTYLNSYERISKASHLRAFLFENRIIFCWKIKLNSLCWVAGSYHIFPVLVLSPWYHFPEIIPLAQNVVECVKQESMSSQFVCVCLCDQLYICSVWYL